MGVAHPFPEERGGVGDTRRLQKRTKMVLGRWPHSSEARQDAPGDEGPSSSLEEEPGGTGKKKVLQRNIDTT